MNKSALARLGELTPKEWKELLKLFDERLKAGKDKKKVNL